MVQKFYKSLRNLHKTRLSILIKYYKKYIVPEYYFKFNSDFYHFKTKTTINRVSQLKQGKLKQSKFNSDFYHFKTKTTINRVLQIKQGKLKQSKTGRLEPVSIIFLKNCTHLYVICGYKEWIICINKERKR